MLASRIGSFEELAVADLFAGSGALALEAQLQRLSQLDGLTGLMISAQAGHREVCAQLFNGGGRGRR